MSMPRYGEYKESATWLGRVPAGWSVLRLMRVASVNDDVLPESTDPEYEIEYVDIGSVSLDRGIERTERLLFSNAPSRARRLVKDGDILVSTVRTYLKAIAPVVAPPRNLVVSTGFAVVRPARNLLSGFGRYALQASGFVDEVISRSTGVSYPAINSSELVRIVVPVPPAEEQSAIADFLDCEIAKIDALIAEQGKLIDLLAEKRQTTISLAVTKGLDPNATMKDSGVAWLGAVPAHWRVKQLKHVAKPGTAITYGIVQAGPHFEGGIAYIKTSDMSGDELPLDGYSLTSPEIDAAYSRSKVAAGDIVIAIRATVGKCLPVPSELAGANLTQGTAKVSPGDEVSTAFLLNSLRSTATQTYFDSMAKGATFKEITLDALRRTPVLVPPREEQQEIEYFVDAETRKLNALERAAVRTINLLRERRGALIAAAVTGQIDVRGN